MIVSKNHSFHIVDGRPWPLMGSIGALILTTGSVKIFCFSDPNLFWVGLWCLFITSFQWWRDIRREGTYQGLHTDIVYTGLKIGIILFIVSEVFFFFSFFWGFFHRSLSPTLEVGLSWPPNGIIAFNPFIIPLLNTIILLSSGVRVTWAHHAILENEHNSYIYSIFITVILGIYFSFLQAVEYMESIFSIRDRVYGSVFFIATGFHGLHVLIGTTFLIVCLIRGLKGHFRRAHHFGFEAAAWYWHFVDVVWLFLYIRIYWWGC